MTYLESVCSVTLVSRFNAEENVFEIFPRAFSGVADQLRRVDRKACTLAIPFSVPEGRKLLISQVDMSATLEVSDKSSATFHFEAFIAGEANKKLSRIVTAKTKPIAGRVLLRQAPVYVSSCGEKGILRLNSSQILKASELGRAQAKVQSLKIYLKAEDCAPGKSPYKR